MMPRCSAHRELVLECLRVFDPWRHAEQHAALKSLGCDCLQGFFFARPLAAEAMRQMLATDRSADAGEAIRVDWCTTMAANLEAPR